MNIIIAPHPDDELIGVFSLIKKRLIDRVLYIDPLPKRLAQAKVVGKNFGFEVYSVKFKDLKFSPPEDKVIYFVPDSFDNHPLHKAVNAVARMSGARLGYYSVDMNTGYTRELSSEMQGEKRWILNKYYPDQKSLWEHDWKYFLFEGIVHDALCSAPITL